MVITLIPRKEGRDGKGKRCDWMGLDRPIWHICLLTKADKRKATGISYTSPEYIETL